MNQQPTSSYWDIRHLLRLLLKFFLQGLLFLAPISITVFVIIKTFEFLDGLLPYKIPGLGLVTVIALITVTGFIGTTFIAKPLMGFIDDLISKAPVVKIIYSSVKDFLEAVVGKKKKFTEPVLVKINENTGLLKLGFITGKELSMLGLDDTYVAVYFPHSYNFSGNLFFVKTEHIIPVKGAPADVMKYVVTAGVTSLEDSSEKPDPKPTKDTNTNE